MSLLRLIKFALLLGIVWLIAACNPIAVIPPSEGEPGAQYTQAVQTVSAYQTLQAGQAAVATLTQMSQEPNPVPATATIQPPTAVIVPATATNQLPTATLIPPTATLVPPTATLVPPTATATPLPCGLAQFVKDVTVPDGEVFSGDEPFTKVWRLKNTGSCTWDRNYALVFVRGNQMDGSEVIYLDDVVQPGETTDIEVDLVAPSNPGEYSGFWQLRTSSGVLFGISGTSGPAFWVRIKVEEPDDVLFDLAAEYCRAYWYSGQGSLNCPGSESNFLAGSVIRLPNPKIESGAVENEPAILVHPDDSTAGLVSGSFPALIISRGSHFHAIVGCAYDNYDCNVMFQLNYKVDGGPIQNLKSWTETYEGSFTRIDVDLSPLAGRSVELILTVLNNGSSDDDWAFWLMPRIVN